MEKLKIAGIVVLVSVAVVLGYILIKDKPASQEIEKEILVDNSDKKMSFQNFMELNTSPHKCIVTQAFLEVESSGVVYLDGSRIRGDFDTITSGKKMHSSFIMKDGFAYNWSDLYPMGAKVKVDNKDTTSNTETSYTWNADKISAYECTPWKVDEAMFVVPTEIQFTEL